MTFTERQMNEISLADAAHPHGNCECASRVLQVCLTGTSGVPHGYCVHLRVLRVYLTGTSPVPHGYFACASQVLRMCLTGTSHVPHRYFACASQVLRMCLTGTSHVPREYCTYFIQIDDVLRWNHKMKVQIKVDP